jgi:hypothetical protein
MAELCRFLPTAMRFLHGKNLCFKPENSGLYSISPPQYKGCKFPDAGKQLNLTKFGGS